MSCDAVSAWPHEFPIRRTLLALLIVPPGTLLIPLLVSMLTQKSQGGWNAVDILKLPVFILIFSWPGYVIFAVLGIPILLLFFRFKLARFWEFAVIGMICTEIPWLVIASTDGRDAATVHALLRSTLPRFGVIGIGSGIITRLIILGRRRPY